MRRFSDMHGLMHGLLCRPVGSFSAFVISESTLDEIVSNYFYLNSVLYKGYGNMRTQETRTLSLNTYRLLDVPDLALYM